MRPMAEWAPGTGITPKMGYAATDQISSTTENIVTGDG